MSFASILIGFLLISFLGFVFFLLAWMFSNAGKEEN